MHHTSITANFRADSSVSPLANHLQARTVIVKSPRDAHFSPPLDQYLVYRFSVLSKSFRAPRGVILNARETLDPPPAFTCRVRLCSCLVHLLGDRR